ncbi:MULTISPECIES: hypothetical protein [unclassified Plantibacter]|uniref:hypothetical protein n=1 Tax=unclassified Plantibacter TaxID=2624265 RepID=UPI000AD7DBA2|nr:MULTISPECIES: hypothetical protein [unclassified Plantibacter]
MSTDIVHRVANIQLRPPRVIVLFRGGERWQDHAREAVSIVSETWGGEGMIYAPYDEAGEVSKPVLRLAAQYDPDYVAVLRHTPETWSDPAGSHSSHSSRLLVDKDATVAAKHLIKHCTTLSWGFDSHSLPQHVLIGPLGAPPQSPFIGAPLIGAETPHSAIAGDISWAGNGALFAAAILGAPQNPRPRTAPDDDALAIWLCDTDEAPPEELLWSRGIELSERPQDRKPWFSSSSPELVSVRTCLASLPGVLVVGDSPDDFALAVGYKRLLGHCIWISAENGGDLTSSRQSSWPLYRALTQGPPGLTFPAISATLDFGELESFVSELSTPWPTPQDGEAVVVAAHRSLPLPAYGLSSLILEEHLNSEVVLPFEKTHDGSYLAQAPIAAPLPSGSIIPVDRAGNPAWIVDVGIYPPSMPSGRRLPAKWMLHPDQRSLPFKIRSSREGASYHAANMGFMSNGALLTSRLARPRLQFLGMLGWVSAVATAQGMTSSLSRPGQHAGLVAARLGGRSQLIDLVSGEHRELLRSFVDRPSRSDESGFQLDKRQLLTWRGIEALSGGADWTTTRDLVDRLLDVRLLRQGLALGCAECGVVSFVTLDAMRQHFECQRCGAVNTLRHSRWNSKSAEPTWFYDLHPSFADIFRQNGDAVLLTANHLRREVRNYADVAEVEFSVLGASVVKYEIDLIAHADNRLVLAEVKTGKNQGGTAKERRRMIAKRFEAARVLQADVVLFAATDAWPDGFETDVHQAADVDGVEYRLLHIEA